MIQFDRTTVTFVCRVCVIFLVTTRQLSQVVEAQARPINVLTYLLTSHQSAGQTALASGWYDGSPQTHLAIQKSAENGTGRNSATVSSMVSFQDRLGKLVSECQNIVDSVAARDNGGDIADNWNCAKLQSNHHRQHTSSQLLQAGCPSCLPANV